MAKLKVELNESSNSLKATLEAMGLLEDKLRQISTKVDNVKSKITALETDLQVKQTEWLKAEEEAKTRRKALAEELAHYQSFLLRISKQCFNKGIRQATYFQGVPIDDAWYDENKDVINGELVSVGGKKNKRKNTKVKAVAWSQPMRSNTLCKRVVRSFVNLFIF